MAIKKSKTRNKLLETLEKKESKDPKKKELIAIECAKMQLEWKKEILDYAVEAIAEYCDDLGIRAIKTEEMKDTEMQRVLELCKDNDKSFMQFMFGEPSDKKTFTELDRIKNEIEHTEKLIKWAEHILKSLSTDVKKKMARDLVENMYAWNLFFDDAYKLMKDKNGKNKMKQENNKNGCV